MKEKSVRWVTYEIDIQNFTSDLTKELKAVAFVPMPVGVRRRPGRGAMGPGVRAPTGHSTPGTPRPIHALRRSACCAASLKPCTRRCFRQGSQDAAGLPHTIPSLVGAPGLTLSDVLRH